MSQINGLMSVSFGSVGALRQMESQQNTKVNGFLIDVEFTPTADYLAGDRFAVFKNMFVDLNLRKGGSSAGSGGSEQLIHWNGINQKPFLSRCARKASATTSQCRSPVSWFSTRTTSHSLSRGSRSSRYGVRTVRRRDATESSISVMWM